MRPLLFSAAMTLHRSSQRGRGGALLRPRNRAAAAMFPGEQCVQSSNIGNRKGRKIGNSFLVQWKHKNSYGVRVYAVERKNCYGTTGRIYRASCRNAATSASCAGNTESAERPGTNGCADSGRQPRWQTRAADPSILTAKPRPPWRQPSLQYARRTPPGAARRSGRYWRQRAYPICPAQRHAATS